MKHISDFTGGEFFKAVTGDELLDMYERIGTIKDFDMTDTDGDGLADIFETAGMKLSNGKGIVYSNPLLADTDGDGLTDGEEINREYKYMVPITSGMPANLLLGNAGIYFEMKSNPNNKDSDGDGYWDNIDTSKLTYSMLITENGKKLVKHNFNVNENGYYVCEDCGFKIKSPIIQDNEILSEDDYVAIISLYQTYLYHLTNRLEKKQGYFNEDYETAFLVKIDEIRSKSEYKNKYDYIDDTGNYYSDIIHSDKTKELSDNIRCRVGITTVNNSNIRKYKFEYVYAPAIYSFLATIASIYNPAISAILTLYSIGVDGNLEFNEVAWAILIESVDKIGISKKITFSSNIINNLGNIGFSDNPENGDKIVVIDIWQGNFDVTQDIWDRSCYASQKWFSSFWYKNDFAMAIHHELVVY